MKSASHDTLGCGRRERLASLDAIAAKFSRVRVDASLTKPPTPLPDDDSPGDWVDGLGWFLDS